jgi:hypothetical protein
MKTKCSKFCGIIMWWAPVAIGMGVAMAAPQTEGEGARKAPSDSLCQIRLLAVGDMNLGRYVGQQILLGDTLYPFKAVADTFREYDCVFGNLESNISDQKGRTQDPRSNTVFTAPPAAAQSLARGGITIVSTANNHALDFGESARNQTLRFLDGAGIAHIGTGGKGRGLYEPVIIVRKGIKIAFFAVTDLMNGVDPSWRRWVAAADTERLLPSIRAVRSSADVIIVSYHGGEEYADRPTSRVRAFAREVLGGGADVFLGHHPHVPYGVDVRDGKVAVYSLGNFVFKQPARFWTRFSFALSITFTREPSGVHMTDLRVLPLHVDFQPEFLHGGAEAEQVTQRVLSFSSYDFVEHHAW